MHLVGYFHNYNRRLVFGYRRFGTSGSHLHRSSLAVVHRPMGTSYRFHLNGEDRSTLEDGADRLSRNVHNQLPTYAA